MVFPLWGEGQGEGGGDIRTAWIGLQSAITAGCRPGLRQKAGMVYPALTALLPIFPPDRPKRSLPFLAKAWLSPCLRASAPISERPDLAWPTRSRCCLATNSRSLRALPALDRAVGQSR